MAIRTSNNAANFELAPAGVHVGRCCRVIDLGTRVDQTFGKRRRQVSISWELPLAPLREDGEPHWVTKRYTLSHNEKASLRLDLESWCGRQFDDKKLDEAGGFDVEIMIGRAALLNVMHSADGKYANVMSVMPVPKSMPCPPAILAPVVFGFDPYDPVKFNALSQSMQEHIKGSEEWQATVNGHVRQPAAGAQTGAAEEGDPLPYGKPAAGPASSPPPVRKAPPAAGGGRFDDMEDDIPF